MNSIKDSDERKTTLKSLNTILKNKNLSIHRSLMKEPN